jgi:hypothetical protein
MKVSANSHSEHARQATPTKPTSPAMIRMNRLLQLPSERDFPVPNQPHCGNGQPSATMGSAISHQRFRKGKSVTILTVGTDLAWIEFLTGSGIKTTDFFRSRIDARIDLRHPLAVLSSRLPWGVIKQHQTARFDRSDRPSASSKATACWMRWRHWQEIAATTSLVLEPRRSF